MAVETYKKSNFTLLLQLFQKAIILEVSYRDSIFPMEAVLTQDRFTSNILLLQGGGGRRRSPSKRGSFSFVPAASCYSFLYFCGTEKSVAIKK